MLKTTFSPILRALKNLQNLAKFLKPLQNVLKTLKMKKRTGPLGVVPAHVPAGVLKSVSGYRAQALMSVTLKIPQTLAKYLKNIPALRARGLHTAAEMLRGKAWLSKIILRNRLKSFEIF